MDVVERHSGILRPEEQRVEVHRVVIALDLSNDIVGTADDEPLVTEPLPLGFEGIVADGVVLSPVRIALILPHQRLFDDRLRSRRRLGDVDLSEETDLAGASVSRRTLVTEIRDLPACELEGDVGAKKAVRDACSTPDTGFVARTDPHRGLRVLDRLWPEGNVRKLEVVAIVRHPLLGPEPLDDFEPFHEPARPVRTVDAERIVFGVAVAETDTEAELAASEHVDRRAELRDANGIMVGEQTQCHREPHVANCVRQVADHRLVEEVLILGDVVFADPNTVESTLSREFDLATKFRPDPLEIAIRFVLGDQQQFKIHIRPDSGRADKLCRNADVGRLGLANVAREQGAQERLAGQIEGGYGLLAAAVGAFFTIMLARIVISPVVPNIITSLSVSRGAVGLALTGMWAAYAVAQFASGVLGTAYGERRIIVTAVGLTGIASLALSQVGSLVTFVAATAFLGGSAGLYFSAGSTLLTRRFEHTGQALGFHSAGGPLAGLVGPVAAVWIATRFGWRSAVALGAAVAFPVCLLFLWRVDRTPATAGDRPLREQVRPRQLADLLLRPPIAFTVGVAVLVYFVWQSFYSFFPTFLSQHWGFSAELSGLLFGGVFAATALALPLLGRLSDALGRDAVLGGTFLALAAGLTLLVIGTRFPIAILGCGLVALGMGFPGVINSRFMDHLAEGERGHGFGLIRTVNLLLGSLGSVVTGSLADVAGWTVAFGLLPVLLLVPLGMVAANGLLDTGL